MKICNCAGIPIPLLFTFKFQGSEYWCPVCGANFDIFGSGQTIQGTAELGARHELLERHCKAYLSSIDGDPPVITKDSILLMEANAQKSDGPKPQIKCDGCGAETDAKIGPKGEILKPSYWYQCTDKDGTQIACSRNCITLIAKKTGKSAIVAPW